MNRQEHLDWCKKRAFEYCEKDQPVAAWISFRSDMNKHDETRDHIALSLGDGICAFFLQTPETIRAVDPFHADAFPDELKEFGNNGERAEGWLGLDKYENPVAFVKDGTKFIEK